MSNNVPISDARAAEFPIRLDIATRTLLRALYLSWRACERESSMQRFAAVAPGTVKVAK